MFKKVFKWLDVNFEPTVMTVLFYSITILITLQVILRFVFSTGFSWGEEVARFLFVWLMNFAISYATRNQRHIKITFLINMFDEKVRKIFLMISDLVFLIFSSLIFLAAIRVCQSAIKYADMAVTIEVSLNIVYGAGVVGYLLIVIRLIQSMIWKIKYFHETIEKYENHGGKFSQGRIFFDVESKVSEISAVCNENSNHNVDKMEAEL